jgi:hypothetical protein
MTTLAELGAALGPLESFDPAAFIGDSNVPQEVCDFVLALAEIHNDYKDLVLAYAMLTAAQPAEPEKISGDRGQFAALQIHVIRLHVSLVDELCKLIEREKAAVLQPAFQNLLTKIDRRAREKWQALMDAAGTKPKDDELTRVIVLLRNKASSHIDPEQLGRGYRHAFVTLGKKPYISRGATLEQTRFYFADLAVTAYLNDLVGGAGIRPFLEGVSKLLESLNIAIALIVEAFIQSRSAWRSETPSA